MGKLFNQTGLQGRIPLERDLLEICHEFSFGVSGSISIILFDYPFLSNQLAQHALTAPEPLCCVNKWVVFANPCYFDSVIIIDSQRPPFMMHFFFLLVIGS